MIFRNGVAKTKLVEQLNLVTLQMAHHGSTSPRIASTQRNHASRPVSTDFCNKIGAKQPVLVGYKLVGQIQDRGGDWLARAHSSGDRAPPGRRVRDREAVTETRHYHHASSEA